MTDSNPQSEDEEETYVTTFDAELEMEVDVTDGVPEVMQAAAEIECQQFTFQTETGQNVVVHAGQITENEKIDSTDEQPERVSIEHELVELLQQTIDHWVNKSSYGSNGQAIAEMCADDIRTVIKEWKERNPEALPELELTQGRRVIFPFEDTMKAGRIDCVDGDYVQLTNGIAVHIDNILPCIYDDEVTYRTPE